MDAIVLAGGIPQPDEPLYPHTLGGNKTLLDIAGKPMVQWVLNALDSSRLVDQILVVGLPKEINLTCSRPLSFIDDRGDIISNINAGAEVLMKKDPLAKTLMVSADIPAITPKIVDWLATTVQETDHDLYYTVIERSVMEKRFPGSKRSYIHLKNMDVCGGDFNAVRVSVAARENPFTQELAAARKNALKQASLIGFDTLFLLFMRRLTLAEAAFRVSRKLGFSGRAIISPYPEVGMDIDKPYQLELLRADLAKRK